MSFRRDSFITHRAFCDALAEENSRSTNNTNVPSPSPTLQQSNSLQIQDFQLKEEHENFTFLRPENIPSWLSQHTIDSSSMFSSNENPNPRVGPTFPAAYQTAASPHMSATALLQKAAEMGATMMGTHQTHQQQQQHAHVSAADSAELGNKAAPASPSSGPGVSSSFLHHAIINSFSSSVGFDGTSFEDTFAAGNILTSNNDDHISITTTDDGGNDGFTRDFLSLRSLSHTDILTIAGMGNCMNSSQSHLPQNQSQKQWQG